MTNLEVNLETITAVARAKQAENLSFKTFLRRFSSAELDALVEQLTADVEPRIDCKQCANCCKSLHAAALEDELPSLAERKQISIEQFKMQFLRPHKEAFYFVSRPCPMLDSTNLCNVYDARPICCRTFPNLTGEHFKYRFNAVMEKYDACPIVFNVVEQLKSVLGFQNAL